MYIVDDKKQQLFISNDERVQLRRELEDMFCKVDKTTEYSDGYSGKEMSRTYPIVWELFVGI